MSRIYFFIFGVFYESDFSLHFQEKTDILISISAAKGAVEKASLRFYERKKLWISGI